MPKENIEWRVSDAEFKGYLRGKLEALHEDVKAISEKHETHNQRLNKVEVDLKETAVKVSIFSIVISLAATAIAAFLGFLKN